MGIDFTSSTLQFILDVAAVVLAGFCALGSWKLKTQKKSGWQLSGVTSIVFALYMHYMLAAAAATERWVESVDADTVALVLVGAPFFIILVILLAVVF